MEQQFDEMQKARKRFWRIFLPLIIYLAVRFLANGITQSCVLITHASEWMDMEKIANLNMDQLMEYLRSSLTDATQMARYMKVVLQYSTLISVLSAVLVAPVGIVFFCIDKYKAKVQQIPHAKVQPVWKYPILVVLGAALCIGLNIILIMCDQAFYGGTTSQSLASTYASPLLLQIIGIGVLVPISEEFFYRGVLYHRYRENSTYARAAVYAGILFALAHGTMIQMIYAFSLGMVLAYAYEKFGSIMAPVIVHISVNITSVLLTNVDAFSWLLAKPMRAGIAAIICAFLSSTVIVYLQNIQSEDVPEQSDQGASV